LFIQVRSVYLRTHEKFHFTQLFIGAQYNCCNSNTQLKEKLDLFGRMDRHRMYAFLLVYYCYDAKKCRTFFTVESACLRWSDDSWTASYRAYCL